MDNEVKYSEEIEKVINAANKSCLLYGTEECRMLNPDGCMNCAVGQMKSDKQEETKKALARLIKAAPPEMLEPLYSGDECLFCKAEKKGKKECYALFDLSKPDPEGDWTIALGNKKLGVKAADMILPLQVSCCNECKKRYRKFDYLPTIAALLIFAAGLIVTTIPAVYKALFAIANWMPIAVMAASVLLAMGADALIKKQMRNAMAKHMKVSVSELPVIGKLMEEGFEEVAKRKQGVSALVFSGTFREHGVCSRLTFPEPDPGAEPQICGIWPAEHFQGPDEGEAPSSEASPSEDENDNDPAVPVPEPDRAPDLLGIVRMDPAGRVERDDETV